MGIVSIVLVLGALIFVHELGHFLVAKFCGVGVLEFALGFGPVLLRWQGKETAYSLRAIPLGGFVRMTGDDPGLVYGEGTADDTKVAGASPIEGTQEELSPEQQKLLKDESRWFLKKSYLPRMAIVLAGPVANFLFAWVLAFVTYLIVGMPNVVDGPVTIGAVQKGMPAEAAGIKTGDRVVSIDGKPVQSFKELVEMVRSSGGKTLQVSIRRPNGQVPSNQAGEGEDLLISIQPLADASPELDVLEGREVNQTYRIGITPGLANVTYTKADALSAAGAAAGQVYELSAQTVRVLKGLITGLLSPVKTIGGPIAIAKQISSSADEGWMSIVGIMIFLNVSLAVMNLLPIPVLDGGHLVFFTLEQLRGKPLSMRAQIAATNFGMVIILSLMVFAIGNDLVRVFL